VTGTISKALAVNLIMNQAIYA